MLKFQRCWCVANAFDIRYICKYQMDLFLFSVTFKYVWHLQWLKFDLWHVNYDSCILFFLSIRIKISHEIWRLWHLFGPPFCLNSMQKWRITVSILNGKPKTSLFLLIGFFYSRYSVWVVFSFSFRHPSIINFSFCEWIFKANEKNEI